METSPPLEQQQVKEEEEARAKSSSSGTKRARSPQLSPAAAATAPPPTMLEPSEAKRTPPPPPPSPPPPPPHASMSSIYFKLFESEVRRRILYEVHEFHHSRKHMQRLGFSNDSFRGIASLPSLQRRASNTPAPLQRRSSRTLSLMLPTNPVSTTTTTTANSIGERPVLSKPASALDLFGQEISPRLETLERFRAMSLSIPEEDLTAFQTSTPAKTLEIVRGLKKKHSLFGDSRSSASATGLQVLPLPRGGHSVQTRIGPIQVGIPPETIKDSMDVGIKCPNIFIIPQQRFHPWRMISVAEFEFPAYFNFFVLQRAVRLVTTKSGEIALRTVFQESLLGPVDLSPEAIAGDFAPGLGPEHFPQYRKERLYFGDNDINKLLEFVPLKEAANKDKTYLEADLGEDMFVRLEASETEDWFVIIDRAAQAEGNNAEAPPEQEQQPVLAVGGRKRRHRRSLSDVTQFPCDLNRETLENKGIRRGSELGQAELASKHRELVLARLPGLLELPNFRSFNKFDVKRAAFVPPRFGVTLLGTSHGFDRESSTTGFVVWINGQGVIVDPPPNSTPMLELMGIAPRQVQHVIITHCHADHDAGTMQKLMLEEHVSVLTTPTIMKSFLRKYSAVSDMAVGEIASRFTFRPARVGEWLPLLGGHLRVFYSFHTIPTVGFEIKCAGKSLVYSGDTFYNPDEIQRLVDVDVLTLQRARNLLDFPWHADLILHECGVAPIHTPLRYLAELPEDVRSRLYLVHVTASSVANDAVYGGAGMQIAKEGVDGTLVLISDEATASSPPAHHQSIVAAASTVLGWIKDCAPFGALQSQEAVHDLLSVLILREYVHGECFTSTNELVIIGRGSCTALDAPRENGASYQSGDCICSGSSSSSSSSSSSENGAGERLVVTSNKLTCLVCSLADVFALPSKEAASALLQWKTDMERNEFGKDMDLVSCLTRRETALFTRLFTQGGRHVLPRGTRLWEAGKALHTVYIILSGELQLTHCIKDERKYDPSQHQESLLQFDKLRRALAEDDKPFMCDLPALYHGLPLRSTLTVESNEVVCYSAPASDFLYLLRIAPALLFKLHKEFTAEATRVQHEETTSDEEDNASEDDRADASFEDQLLALQNENGEREEEEEEL